MNPVFSRSALGAALLGLCGPLAWAQSSPTGAAAVEPQPAAPSTPPAGPPATPAGPVAEPTAGRAASLGEVTVTGNPLGRDALAVPAQQFSGTGLLLRGQGTLGQTLDGAPGVSSTYFGPNASRPIIRGLDGDRIRLLANGTGLSDASGLSYDHAVAADPLTMERIEVLRGPAALQYGGGAVGGVVNVIDGRIPRAPLFDAAGGVSGRADLGLATGNRERSAAAVLETGNDRYALHVDAFDRRSADLRVPLALACSQGGVTTQRQRLCNSAGASQGGAVGGTLFFDRGHLGASLASHQSGYGTVAEDEARIRLHSERLALEGELRGLGGWFSALKGQFSHSRYQHTEFDAGEPRTTFGQRGSELRLEARQARLGALEGVVGLQAESGRFSAVGDEAFAPPSRTRQWALFAHEELGLPWGRLSFGSRVERVRVGSDGSPDTPRFAVGERRFTPVSHALGALLRLGPAWQANANLAYTERAPKDYELFANGPHAATGTYELGDAGLGKERSLNLDLGLKWQQGPDHLALGAFVHRFRNYLSLEATGQARDSAGHANASDCGDGHSVESGCSAELLPEYAYRQVRARFAGVEASGSQRLWGGPSTLDLEWRADLVRATNLDSGEPLPRIAPARLGATLAWAQGAWGWRLGAGHAMAQRRVPAGQLATPGHTLWNAALTYRVKAGPSQLLWYARLDNLGNRLAYAASSILTQTAPGRVPLPGRSLKLGLRVDF